MQKNKLSIICLSLFKQQYLKKRILINQENKKNVTSNFIKNKSEQQKHQKKANR